MFFQYWRSLILEYRSSIFRKIIYSFLKKNYHIQCFFYYFSVIIAFLHSTVIGSFLTLLSLSAKYVLHNIKIQKHECFETTHWILSSRILSLLRSLIFRRLKNLFFIRKILSTCSLKLPKIPVLFFIRPFFMVQYRVYIERDFPFRQTWD